jgi:hypothetical protein
LSVAHKVFQTDRPSAEQLLDLGQMSAKVSYVLGDKAIVMREGTAASAAFKRLARFLQWAYARERVRARVVANFSYYLGAHMRRSQIAREDLDRLSVLSVGILETHLPHLIEHNARWLALIFVRTGLIHEGTRQRLLNDFAPGTEESWDADLQSVFPFLHVPKTKTQAVVAKAAPAKPVAPQPFYGAVGRRRIVRRTA